MVLNTKLLHGFSLLAVVALLSACDAWYGLDRTGPVSSLPDPICVQQAINSTEKAKLIRYIPFTSDNSAESHNIGTGTLYKPLALGEKESGFPYTYGKGRHTFGGYVYNGLGISFIKNPSGKNSYWHYFHRLQANTIGASKELKEVRSIMDKVEANIENSCKIKLQGAEVRY